MKALKIAMTVIAWLGIFITLLGFIGMIWVNIDDLSHLQLNSNLIGDNYAQNNFRLWFLIGLYFSIPGVLLASIGGIIARPSYYWPILTAVGTIYCISNTIGIILPVLERNFFISESLLVLLPGIVCIIGGLIIRWLRVKQSIRISTELAN